MDKAEKRSSRILNNLLGYLVAVASVALATWLKFLAQPTIIPADVPILYLLAIVPTAIFFGFGQALLVCVLSFLAYDYYFIPPIHQITFDITETPIVVIFLVVGVLFSYLASNLREKNRIAAREITARKQSEAELITYRDHLEELVQQRTSDLEKTNLALKEEISEHKKDEEALRQSEQRWATTLASIGDGVVATDVSGNVSFINTVAEALTGWKMVEANQKPVSEVFNIINETTRQKAENPVDKVLQRGIICSLANHTILIRKDGSEISIDDSGAPIKNMEGVTTGVVLVFRDITERRKAEKVLHQMEERNRLLADILEHASQPFGIGLPDGSLGIVNKAFCDLTGYTSEELKTMDWAKVLTPPEYQTMEAEKLNTLIKTGQPVRYQKEYIRKDNSRVPIELFVSLARSSNGKVEYYYSFLTDITERRKADEEKQTTLNRFYSVLSEMPTGILLVSEDGLVEFANQTFCDVFDIKESPADLRNRTSREIIEKIQIAYVNQEKSITRIMEILARGEPVKDEDVPMRSGRTLLRDFVPLRLGENKYGRLWIHRDITERKKIEDALKESEAKANALIKYAPTGIYEIDYRTQRFLSINDAMSALTGYTKEELFALGPGAMLDEDSKKLFAARIRRQLAGEKIDDSVEYRVRKKDGSTLWITLNIAFSNNPNTALVIGHDITERIEAEKAVQESEEKFSKAFNSSNVGLVITTLSDGRWVDANNTYLKMLEYTLEEVLGRTANEINLYPDPAQRTQILQTLKEEGVVKETEVRLRTKSGQIIETLSSVNRINLQGQECTLSTIVDITQIKQAEAEINRLNRELKAIGECDQAIVHANTEQALLNEVCSILHLTAGYRMAWIGSVEHDQNKSVRPIAWSGDEEYLKNAKITWANNDRGRGPTGSAGREGKTYFFQDFVTAQAASPWRESALSLGYRSSIAVPMFDNVGTVFAVLTLYSTVPNYFNDSEIQLLESLAGDIAFGIVALRDRVKRQQAEAEITHLASFPELNPNPILEIDSKGNVKYSNPAAKKEFPAMSQGDKHEFLMDMISSIQKGEMPSVTQDINIGKSWYEETLNYVAYSNNYLLYGRNITARKEAEEALKESEEKFSKAFHSSPVGLVITHLPDGQWVDANETYLKMLEYTREEVMGRTSNDLNLYPDTNKRAEIFRLLREEGKISNFELRLRTKTGKIIDTLSSVEIFNLHNEEFSLSTNVDITERKKAEEELKQRTIDLEASNKELEAFSYSVSHDLRAPLRSISGFSNVLLEDYSDELDNEGKSYLKKISDSGELMGQLMDDLLKLSRVTRSDLTMERLDLSNMARKIVGDLGKDEPKRKVKVAIAPKMIADGDKNLLSLVLQNLLGNAWKYSSKTAEPRIEMGVTTHNGKQAYFVRDNGVGFDMAYADKLFQPFQRLHKASEFAGTGIGLATVQRIIRRHGGDVWAEGKVGQGATFYFTLS